MGKRGPKASPLPDDWQTTFIATLRRTGKPFRACIESGVRMHNVWYHRTNDPSFRQAYEEAVQYATEAGKRTVLSRNKAVEFLFGDRPQLPLPKRVRFVSVPDTVRAALVAGELSEDEAQDLLDRERKRGQGIVAEVDLVEQWMRRR